VLLVPPFAIGNTPVTPVVRGKPVKLVATPDDGVPNAGVTRIGDVLNTTEPVPVDVVTPVPPFNTGSVPVTPVVSGKPVALVRTTADGVPKAGVINVGLLFNTTDPVPVDVVVPVPPLATSNDPTTPVVKGKPVALVNTADVGVPSAGETKDGVVIVGLVDNTNTPVPVAVVLPVPPFRIANVPVTPVVNGKPVALVNTPETGVPSNGAIKVGPLASTSDPVPVEVVVPVPPFTTASVPVTPVDKGNPVKFVAIPDVGVPNKGVTSVGLVLKTTEPVPVADVTPVPPLATASSPPTVTTPDVGIDGVNPVVPKEMDDTALLAAKVVQPSDEYPSKALISVEYRIWPRLAVGRCAVLPSGSPTAPDPGNITFVGNPIVGFPTPLPFATVICVAVPVIVIGVALVPATASNPVPEVAAIFDTKPEYEINGLSAIPSGFVTDSPLPTVITRLATVLVAVLT
jgi:hypothetical protein